MMIEAAPATRNPTWYVAYRKLPKDELVTATGPLNGGTPVTLVPAPTGDRVTAHQIEYLHIRNWDTATVSLMPTIAGITPTIELMQAELPRDDIMTYAPDQGWRVHDSDMVVKTITTAASNAFEVIDVAPTEVAVVNDDTEQTLYSFLVPANTMGSDGVLKCIMGGWLLNTRGAGEASIWRIKFGGTTIYQGTTFAIGSGVHVIAWEVRFILANRDNTASQIMTGRIRASYGLSPTTGYGSIVTDEDHYGSPIAGTAAEDTAAGALLLDVTIDHTTAHASVWTKKQFAMLERATS